MKRSSKCLKGFFYIKGKLKLQCLTILWKSRGVFELGNPEGREAQAVLEIQVGRGGGGSKNHAFRRGGVDFFWNNLLTSNWFQHFYHVVRTLSMHNREKRLCELIKILSPRRNTMIFYQILPTNSVRECI